MDEGVAHLPIIREAQVCPKHKVNRVREYTAVISSFRWKKQKDLKFEVILGCVV